MRQIIIPRHGPPEVFEIREAPDPVPGPGEVRIRVEAAGINFADVMARMGLYPDAPPLPAVVGFEVAGVVDAVGPGVPARRVGTAVFALMGAGGYTDVCCVPTGQVFDRPAGLSATEGAALPVVYLTAYVALCVMGSLAEGDRVLVHNAGGGVGLAALDICRIVGATAYGTASGWKHDALGQRGAAACIDYRKQDFEAEIRRLTGGKGLNVVLDPLGGRSWAKSYRCLAPTGRLVMYGLSSSVPGTERRWGDAVRALLSIPWFSLNPMRLLGDSRALVGVNLQQIRDRPADVRRWTERLRDWVEMGAIVPTVDRTFAFSEAAAAHRYLQDRRNLGKVVLVPG